MPTVLNLGSVNLDHVYHTERFVAPGETMTSRSLIRGAGGKGYNQSIALARAGARVAHAGCLGREAEWLREKLADEAVDVSRLLLVDETAGHAIIQVVPSGENSILLHPGANHALRPGRLPALFAGLGPDDWFLTQNETSCVPEAIRLARQAVLTVCFNPAPMGATVRDFPLAEVDWLFVNESEGAALSGLSEASDPAEVLARLRPLCPRANLVLTLGAAGAWCAPAPARGGGLIRCAAPRVQAVDTTAAGDAFIGYFIAALLHGSPAGTALNVACRAAAVCVTCPGAADSVPFAHEIDLALLPPTPCLAGPP